MDIALLNRGWNRTWSDTMVNLEARKLVETANRLSAFHLHDSLTKIKFDEEIKQVVEQQFAAARHARSDKECILCIKNLRAETKSLQEQDRLLRAKAAKLYAKVEFIRENNKIVGYVISAVHVVLSGMVIAGGALMISTMTPIGMLAGAILIMDGINELSTEVIPGIYGEQYKNEGFFADGAMEAAQFIGFKRGSGLALYNSLTLSASITVYSD